ncbi:hypothetical protein GZ77_05820 [Endozoicomonas montiporae]|uniref:Thioredoxin domain-containing protein n=2 Tax=Endozoicomonas montiporae TaxID=1027273 RepID=A0A081NC20_9GAMM|nr:DsbE family thiol:disulfide interchange protein [Endozoicomonas montiporae]AMO56316.1 cytochrome c biogenesis protein CcmG [Endozoicomonas montiporae CL-33]KEQ15993.1 hypothetical protein GZ77_05820 [Endozoicomonas montiporae]
MKRFIPLLVFAALAVLLYVGLQQDNKSVLPTALLNRPMPEFSLPSLLEPEQTLSLADMPDESFLLNVWGSWCPACKVEHPYLVELAGQGVPIVGVNYKDDRQDALQWLERLHDPYRFSLVDADGRFGIELGVYGAPETFLVDRKGIIRYRHVGVVNRQVWEQDLLPRIKTLEKEHDQ